MPIIGGMLIALGFSWIFAWLAYRWLLQTGMTGQRPDTAFKTRTRAENSEMDRQAREDYRRTIAFLRQGVPFAALVLVAGIVVAVV